MSYCSSNNAEEIFLRNRQERLNQLKNNNNHAKASCTTSEVLNEFWTRLRVELMSWNQRLDKLYDKYNSRDEYEQLSKEQEKEKIKSSKVNPLEQRQCRNELRTELTQMQNELEVIRKHCFNLHSSSCSNTNNVIQISMKEDWNIPSLELLPVSDVRLLHYEFTKCNTKWESVRDKLLPKTKFVFKKYREAKAKQQEEENQKQNQVKGIRIGQQEVQQQSSSTSTLQNMHEESNKIKSTKRPSISNGIIYGYSYCDIYVDDHGQVTVMDKFQEQDNNLGDDQKPAPAMTTSIKKLRIPLYHNSSASNAIINPSITIRTSLNLEHLSHSTVIIQSASITAFYLNHLQDCSIEIMSPSVNNSNTESSVGGICFHISSCNNIEKLILSNNLRFQQLRLFQSSYINCYNFIHKFTTTEGQGGGDRKAGIILEDCHSVIFYVSHHQDNQLKQSTLQRFGNNEKSAQLRNRRQQQNVAWYENVQDFNWLRSDTPSPNFKVLETAERVQSLKIAANCTDASSDSINNSVSSSSPSLQQNQKRMTKLLSEEPTYVAGSTTAESGKHLSQIGVDEEDDSDDEL